MKSNSNYLMPFMWIRDGEHDKLVSHIEDIQSMGHNALCVESRPHNNFCKDEWWDDMSLILSECKNRNMDVWLLDDKYFPTGYVNGAIREKYPELHGRTMIERCLDVVGPLKDTYFQIMYQHPSDRLIGVYAYPREEKGNRVTGKPICLDDKVHGNRVYADIPEGIWRICYFIHTEQFIDEDYINVVDEKACELLLKEVYEPHYARYKEYFGNTFKGFFSDEPSFHNNYYEKKLSKGNVYDRRIGDVGLALLYSDELLKVMEEELGENPVPYFYGLWYELDGESERIRHCYMNAATKLYKKNFSQKIGDWCRAHGVDYIGHVIEDNGCHARMTYGAGHYFRAISGQSMGGIDIVLHQVEPGFADHNQIISCGKFGNTEFFHYGLGKLASSISHIYPHMQNRAAGCTVSALDLLNQKHYTLPARDNKVSITLEPYQSIILFVGESQHYPLLEEFEMSRMSTDFVWDISLYDTVDETVVKEYKNVTELFNLNGYDACPNFTGKATYSTKFTLDGTEKNVQLRIFAEGQTVGVAVNGNPAELKICNPYIFDISDKVHEGENTLEITLCNTLANKIDEKYTAYLPIYAGGMIELPHIYIEKA